MEKYLMDVSRRTKVTVEYRYLMAGDSSAAFLKENPLPANENGHPAEAEAPGGESAGAR